MSNWGDGYRQGYYAAAKKLLASQKEIDEFMKDISKGKKDGAPSLYAVANKCCGGIDAHSAGCRG